MKATYFMVLVRFSVCFLVYFSYFLLLLLLFLVCSVDQKDIMRMIRLFYVDSYVYTIAVNALWCCHSLNDFRTFMFQITVAFHGIETGMFHFSTVFLPIRHHKLPPR